VKRIVKSKVFQTLHASRFTLYGLCRFLKAVK
jgi:hypothetical protein